MFIGPKNALSVEAEVQAETVSEKRTGEKAVASSAGPEATSQETAEARVEAQPSQMVQIAEEAEVVEVIAETEDATRTEESTTEGTRVPVAADQEVKEAGTAISKKQSGRAEIVVEVILQYEIVISRPVPAELLKRREMEHADLAHAHTHLVEATQHAPTAGTREAEVVLHQEQPRE